MPAERGDLRKGQRRDGLAVAEGVASAIAGGAGARRVGAVGSVGSAGEAS